MAKSNETDDILGNLQADLNKTFGAGSANRLDDTEILSKIDDWVSTRSMVVDSVLRGGRPVGASLVPFGRQMEISGLENTGKTSACAQIAAEVQANDGIVIVTDTEERIAHSYWRDLGVDTSKVIHLSASGIEEVFDKQYRALQFARDRCGDKKVLLIWDSLGGTPGVNMLDEKAKESPMEQAKKFGMREAGIISKGITLINGIISKTRACYLYTNHEYTDMKVTYGDPRKTKGGNKPRYMATVRLRLTSVGRVKEVDPVTGQDQIIGQKIRVRALKNNMAGVLMERDAVLMAHKGFVDGYTVFDAGVKLGVITKKGSWSTWITPKGEELKFQGWSGFESKVIPHAEYKTLYTEVEAGL